MTPRTPQVAARALSIAFVVAFSLPGAAGAQSLAQIFERANRAYFAGNYDAAASGFESLVEAGVRDADVYFNLGTSYAKQKKMGLAIVNFERSIKRRPGDEEAERGLLAAHRALGKQRAEAEGEAVVAKDPPLGQALVRGWRESTLAWSVLAFNLLLFGLLVARWRWHEEAARLGLGIAALVSGALLLLAATGLAIKHGATQGGPPAIVVEDQTSIQEGPDRRSATRGRVREGERVELLDRAQGFVRVRAGNQAGWVAANSVQRI